MLKTTAVILISLSACFTAACGHHSESETQRTLHLYVSAPMTGGRGGEDTAQAVRIAVDNAGGRIDGATIKVISLNDAADDGQFDPTLVRRNARRAAVDERTVAYIGEFDSGATEIAMPILNRAGILQVSSASTAVNLTDPTPAEAERLRPTGIETFGRVIPNDDVQAGALVVFMHEESVKKVYAVDDGGTYGAGLLRLFDEVAGSSNLDVIGKETVDDGTDAQALARKVATSGADAFFFSGSNLSLAYDLFQAVHREDPHVKLFGGDGLALSGFLTTLGDTALDTYLTAPMLPEGNYARSGEDFLDAFHEELGRDAEPMSVFGYEAGSVVLDSIRRGVRGDIATESISQIRHQTRTAFFDTSERPSPLGSYSIDTNGDTTLAFYGAYRAEDGALVLGRTIDVPIETLEVLE
jgi:branched-chain amino acid transport system substrate-binding protein